MRVISTNRFMAGSDLTALNYPSEWREHEVRDIPAELFAKMRHTNPLSISADDFTRWEHLQPKFERICNAWREEQSAQRTRNTTKTRERAIREEVERLLYIEQAEKIGKLRAKAAKNLGFTE